MVYTADLKSADRKVVRVRLPPRAPLKNAYGKLFSLNDLLLKNLNFQI